MLVGSLKRSSAPVGWPTRRRSSAAFYLSHVTRLTYTIVIALHSFHCCLLLRVSGLCSTYLLPRITSRSRPVVSVQSGRPKALNHHHHVVSAGKTYTAKLIKDQEVANKGSAPRILSLDDYFCTEKEKTVTDSDTGKAVTKKVGDTGSPGCSGTQCVRWL